MQTADAAYRAGDVAAARRLALDAGDLRLAGVCSVELGDLDDAVDLLRRASAADPAAVVDLAHVLHAAGRTHEALDALRAAPATDEDVATARLAFAVASGRLDEACDVAATLAARRPDDADALLAAADLAATCERWEPAAAAFARLRVVDRADGHRAFACLGHAEALAHAGRWRDALAAALDAARTDRGQLATDLLACVNARVFGRAGRLAPPWEDIAPELAAARVAHRRLHAEAR